MTHNAEIDAGRWMCRECGAVSVVAGMLTAPNPFRPDDTIHGCPDCAGIDCFDLLCDEPDCERPTTCGTPTANGYRGTCGLHVPRVTPPGQDPS